MSGSMPGMSGGSMPGMPEGTMAGMSMPGMSRHGAMAGMSHGSMALVPEWLAIAWMLGFVAVILVHGRHLVRTRREERAWHAAHVVMAIGMVVMYLPGSIDSGPVAGTLGQLVCANTGAAILVWMIARRVGRQPTPLLWLLLGVDMAAMVYMWDPSGFIAPVTWALVAYLIIQAIVWGCDVHPVVAHLGRGAARLSNSVQVRMSLVTMMLGMAYMVAAVQVAH